MTTIDRGINNHMATDRNDILPRSLSPRGVNRVQASVYVGVSPSLFDEMIADGRMPKPKRVNTRTIWDVHQLDIAFDALPDEVNDNPWDEVIS
jgi:hypothetical protein